MKHCDLCGSESGRVSVVEDLWGLGSSTVCEDATACADVWAPSFEAGPTGEPHEADLTPEPEGVLETRTRIVFYGPTFDSADKADPPTRRLARA